MGARTAAVLVTPDQRWFQHPEMQRRIRQAEADIDAGRVTVTRTVAEAHVLLDRRKRRGGRRRHPAPRRQPRGAA